MKNAAPVLEIIECTAESASFTECFAIRLDVFVREQQVALADEQDDLDATARHFLARLDGKPVGTARLLTLTKDLARIGRVAVLASCRGKGVGAALMRHIEALTHASTIILDAQVQAMRFYTSLGYEAAGEIFLEAGIAHRRMHKHRPIST